MESSTPPPVGGRERGNSPDGGGEGTRRGLLIYFCLHSLVIVK